MTIYVDTLEKPYAIVKILKYFEQHGIEVIHKRLGVGDYAISPDSKLVVDRKISLVEVCKNLTTKDHHRFTRECLKAQQNGVHLIILVEHGGKIKTMQDVKQWENPRKKKSAYAVGGERLYWIMRTYQEKYGVEWRFCDKRSTGRVIVEILGGHDGEQD